MTLKIMLNGQMKTIASRRTKPVIFINGTKKRLTKGVTFINGEKVNLWGYDQTMEFFSFSPQSTIYSEPLVEIDHERFVTFFDSSNTGGTVLYNALNTSNVQLLANYSWGGRAIYNPSASDSSKFVFHLRKNKTCNTINYTYGASTMSVSSVFTGTALSSSTYRWMVRLSNGNTLWGYNDSYRSGSLTMYNGYLGLNNNVVWSETGVPVTTMSINAIFNGTDKVYNYVSSNGRYAVYSNTSSGHTYINTVPYEPSMCDGNNFVCCGLGGVAKITSSGSEVWNKAFPNHATGNQRTGVLLGKSEVDALYYVLDMPYNTSASDQNVYLRKYDVSTGNLLESILANHYDANDNLITKWNCVAHRSDSGYLGATCNISGNGYVMRVYVGS